MSKENLVLSPLSLLSLFSTNFSDFSLLSNGDVVFEWFLLRTEEKMKGDECGLLN